MNRNYLEQDRIEIRRLMPFRNPDEEPTVRSVIKFSLPHGAGIHRFRAPSGRLMVVDMTFRRINPAGDNPHVVISGSLIRKEVIIDLTNGVGKKQLSPQRDVIFDASKLTRELVFMHIQDTRPRKGW